MGTATDYRITVEEDDGGVQDCSWFTTLEAAQARYSELVLELDAREHGDLLHIELVHVIECASCTSKLGIEEG